jgi:hypothetical protein
MKVIKVSLERLKDIVKYIEENKNMPYYFRTCKINKTEDYFLQVMVER